MWVLFKFEDGGNPYITKTEKEYKRIIKKYGDKVQKIKDDYFIIKKEKEIKIDFESPLF